jgi:hypothetical protein
MEWVTQLVQDGLISRPFINPICKDPISKWGPTLRSQVTELLEKSPFPSVLWDLTIFQYGGLTQWSG